MILAILIAVLLSLAIITGAVLLKRRREEDAIWNKSASALRQLEGIFDNGVPAEWNEGAVQYASERASWRARKLSRIYDKLSWEVPTALRRPNDTAKSPFRRGLEVRASIMELSIFLDTANTDPSSFPDAKLQRDYIALVRDASELCSALPFRVSSEPELKISPHGCFEAEIFDPWFERLEKLLKLTKEFQRDVSNYHLRRSAVSLSKEFNYGGERSETLPEISQEELPEHERAVLQHSLRTLPLLPMVEKERVKRALGTISEAQRLKHEVQRKEGITIEGKSPDEVVREIISRSVTQLEQAQKGTTHPPEDALEVLYIYSRSLEG